MPYEKNTQDFGKACQFQAKGYKNMSLKYMLGLLCEPTIIIFHWIWIWYSGGTSNNNNKKKSTCQSRRCNRLRLDLWVRMIPWRRKWHCTPSFLPGKFHGQRSLAGYSPWSCKEAKELNTTEQAHSTHTHQRQLQDNARGFSYRKLVKMVNSLSDCIKQNFLNTIFFSILADQET